mgnify:FL=1
MPLKNKKTGFTLVEIMVSVSIFVSVALLVTSAVITTSETNRKAQAIKVAIDNLSFALDSMSLKIRQGNTFDCMTSATDAQTGAENCEDGGIGVTFNGFINGIDVSGISYRISDAVLEYKKTTGDAYVSITDSSLIDITDAKFYVWNAQSDTSNPPRPKGKPRVGIALKGRTKDPKLATEFYLQTTVSGK